MGTPHEHIKNYLNENPLDALRIRSLLFLLLFFFGDLAILLTAFSDPFEAAYVYVVAPPIAILHIFVFWVAYSPYKRQVQGILMLGIAGLITSLGFLASAHKIMFGIMGLGDPLYFIILLATYIVYFLMIIRSHLSQLQKGQKPKQLNYFIICALIVLTVHIVIGFTLGQIQPAIFSAAFFILSLLTALFSLHIHKFILIQRHSELYKLDQPPKSKRGR